MYLTVFLPLRSAPGLASTWESVELPTAYPGKILSNASLGRPVSCPSPASYFAGSCSSAQVPRRLQTGAAIAFGYRLGTPHARWPHGSMWYV